ncbi:MAG: exodeoxyribonuclease VII large subunit [Cryomorphaceae bacterium]|jgi:exodeoxyribonuclease VII large subunit|nr:exodeoxyribonuclease VII large subunit [Cryomorphaceae bacterium]
MKKTFTLTQLVESVKSVINRTYGENAYWVTAELVKLNIKGGHYYLELADSVEGFNTAQMKAVVWRTQVLALQTNLGEEFKQLMQPGNRLLFKVSVAYHEIYGLSLTIHDLDPAFTYGEIELKKKQTIERLKQEGLYDLQKQLKLPMIIKRVVLIGSPDTSGYRDFLTEITTNNIYRNFTIQQIATTVQGDKAVAEICQALQEADTYDADAIILIRGGGSKMDLNVFNDYQICSAIAGLRLPVITGIGHETDEVVADLVAHTRQITPTAVAKFLYVRVGTFRADLQTNLDRVLTQALSQMARATEQFTNTNKFLSHYFQHIITEYRTDLQSKLHLIQLFTADTLAEERSMLQLALNRGGTASVNYLKILHEIELPGTLDRILVNAQNLIDISRLEMNAMRDKIELLNPLKLLKVGYTISSIDHTDLAQYTGDYIGKELQTLTDQFTIYSTITKIQK